MSTAVSSLFEFKHYRDRDYLVTVSVDRYKQLAKATLYHITRRRVFAYGAGERDEESLSPLARLERYGIFEHTYIVKVFFYRNEALLGVYGTLFKSASELLGLPRASVNVLNIGGVVVYEVEVEGLKHVFRGSTTGAKLGWTVVMKNSRAKVLADLHKFARFRDIPESLAREIDELWHRVNKACDEVCYIVYNTRRMIDEEARKQLDKYYDLCYDARHLLKTFSMDFGGIFISKYRSAEYVAKVLRSWLQRLSTALEELKQTYAYIALTL
jgi:hypothetical protein